MKKIILSVMMMVMVTELYAGGLDNKALFIKQNSPKGYELIKKFAVKKWGDDHSMVLFEINTQSDDADLLIDSFFRTKDIKSFANAIKEWSYNDYSINLGIFISWLKGISDYGTIYTMTVDWSMVYYEYDRQVKASKEIL